jgi:hypothetical protein
VIARRCRVASNVQRERRMKKILLLATLVVGACTDELDSATIGQDTDVSGDAKADNANASLHVEIRPIGTLLSNGFCWNDHYDIHVDYKNTQLPWGTSVSLHRGISGWSNNSDLPQGGSWFDWWWTKDVGASSIAGWTWRANDVLTRSIELSEGQIKTSFDFVIQIRLPDGKQIWDNGGSNYGFYRVDLESFGPDCSGNTPFSAHAITKVAK